MNKEIEELLKNIKDKYSYEPYDNTGNVYTTISYEEGQLLLSYIEQLEKENEKTRMRNDMLRKDINSFIKDYKIDYKSRIDKAIEVIDLITPELWNISNAMTYKLKDIKYILKGDSDE